MTLLSEEQLRKLGHPRLYGYFRHLRSIVSSIYTYAGRRCCEICHEYIGNNWEADVASEARPYEEAMELAKAELHRRPFVDYSARGRAVARKERIGGLKGNRNRLRDRSNWK